MSRYYFHIRTPHGLAPDADGFELDSLGEARAVAEIAAREAIVEMVYEGEIRLDLAIEISDERGTPVFAVRYTDVVKLVGGKDAFWSGAAKAAVRSGRRPVQATKAALERGDRGLEMEHGHAGMDGAEVFAQLAHTLESR